MENINPYLIDVGRRLGSLKTILDNYTYCFVIGGGLDQFIYYNLGTYQLYIGYVPGVGYKSYLMIGKEIISNIDPVKTIDQVLSIVNTVEQFRDNHLGVV